MISPNRSVHLTLMSRLFLLVLFPLVAWSSEDGGPESHAAIDHHGPHTLGVFIGDTSTNRRVGVTLGLEYEYHLSERFGVGLTAEYVGGDFQNNVFVLPFAIHEGPWKVYAGPGFERGRKGDHPLFRVGLERAFHWQAFELAPQVDLDFVDGETLFVIGLVVAKNF